MGLRNARSILLFAVIRIVLSPNLDCIMNKNKINLDLDLQIARVRSLSDRFYQWI